MKYIKVFENFDEIDFKDIRNLKTNEYTSDFKNVIEILERDCKPFLDEMKSNKIEPIFRSAERIKLDEKGMIKKLCRTDRRPVSTAVSVSNQLDQLFLDKFGVKLRSNGVFTSKQKELLYGNPYLFFPIGNYKYYWSPSIKDLYATLNLNYNKYYGKSLELEKLIDTYQDNDLKAAGYQEITFVCNEYYLIDYLYLNEYIEYLNE